MINDLSNSIGKQYIIVDWEKLTIWRSKFDWKKVVFYSNWNESYLSDFKNPRIYNSNVTHPINNPDLGEYIGGWNDWVIQDDWVTEVFPQGDYEVVQNNWNDYVFENTVDKNFPIREINKNYQSNYNTLIRNGYSIQKIQIEMLKKWIIKKEDLWIFWPATWNFVYQYHQEYYKDSYDDEVNDRAKKIIKLNEGYSKEYIIDEFHKDVKWYETKKRKSDANDLWYIVWASDWKDYIMDVDNIKNYWKIWNYDTKPIKNTYLAKWLYNKTKNEPRLESYPKHNNIYVFRNSFNNKFTLHYYLWWKLRVCTYVSPWARSTPSEMVINWRIWGSKSISINHISNSDNGKNRLNSNTWWVLPNAVPIPTKIEWNEWQFVHWSLWTTWEPASHGCVRVPPFYIKALSMYLWAMSSKITFLDVD